MGRPSRLGRPHEVEQQGVPRRAMIARGGITQRLAKIASHFRRLDVPVFLKAEIQREDEAC